METMLAWASPVANQRLATTLIWEHNIENRSSAGRSMMPPMSTATPSRRRLAIAIIDSGGAPGPSASMRKDMADMAGAGGLDLGVLEHHVFPLADVNEALDNMPERHGGFTNFIIAP
jgi:hypothetical protein